MRCQKCQSEISIQGVRFCPFCGESFSSRPEERRNGIIAFADLSGFTALSESVDPDVLRDLVDQIMKRFVAMVEDRGGTIDKIIGDCIMFLFNVERSYGDDQFRAMETVDGFYTELESFNRKNDLQMALHVGVAFGKVSVGVVGTSRTVMGDAVNLASRLLNVAQSGEVVVSQSFADLFGPGYQFEALEPRKLKGIAEKVTPCLYKGRVEFQEEETPFIGRGEELRALQKQIDRFIQARTSESVLLTGPAGIGKSRLIAELRSQLPKEKIAAYTLYFDEGGQTFHAPFQKFVQKILTTRRSTEEAKGFQMWEVLSQNPDFWKHVTPEQLEELIGQLCSSLAERIPILLFFENLQRADPTALSVLLALVERFRTSPIFLVATGRTKRKGFSRTINLGPLSEPDASALFESLVDVENLPSPITAYPIHLCAGNPLIIQELSRSANRRESIDNLFTGNIELLLSSTLDALGDEELELVKQASVFGSRISLHGLADLANQERSALLAQLRETGLFYFLPADGILVFRNDLLRKSAYERINLSARKELHLKIAELLAQADAFSEEVAYHFIRTNEKERALHYCLLAGKRLSRLPQQDKAREFIDRAEALAEGLSQLAGIFSARALRFEIDAREMKTEKALQILEQWKSDEDFSEDPEILSELSLLTASFLYERERFQEAQQVIEMLRHRGADLSGDGDILHTRIMGRQGDYQPAVRTCLQALKRKELTVSQKGELWNLLGQISYNADNEIKTAEDAFCKALAAFQKARNDLGARRVYRNLGNTAFAAGDYLQARENYLKSCDLSIKLGDVVGYAQALLNLGRSNELLLQFDTALSNYRQATETLGVGLDVDLHHQLQLFLAELLYILGADEPARSLADLADVHFGKTEDPFFWPKTKRLLANFQLAGGHPEQARQQLRTAIEAEHIYPDQLQLALLDEVELLIESDQPETATSALEKFRDKFQKKQKSHFIQLKMLRLTSNLKRPGNAESVKQIIRLLSEVPADAYPLERLQLMQELQRHDSPSDQKDRLEQLRTRIREAVPDRYRDSFAKRWKV